LRQGRCRTNRLKIDDARGRSFPEVLMEDGDAGAGRVGQGKGAPKSSRCVTHAEVVARAFHAHPPTGIVADGRRKRGNRPCLSREPCE
jgi:hypothetical protein